MGCYRRGKPEELRDIRVLLQLCPPQSPHGAAWSRILSSVVSSRRLTSPVYTVLEHTSVGLPSAPNRQVLASKCVLWLGSCNTHLSCAFLMSPSMLHRHLLTQHTILFGFSYLTRKKKSHNVGICRHTWCSYSVHKSSAVSSTLHWLLLTFKSQGSYALVSLAD